MFAETFSVTCEQGQCNFLNSKSNISNVYCNGITALLFSAAVQFNQLCCVHVASALISAPENSLHQHHGILLMSGKKTAKEIISHPERSSRLLISRYCTDVFQHSERTKGRQTEERKRWKERMKQTENTFKIKLDS